MMPPRIRGRAGQAIEGDHVGKWYYDVSFWTFDGEKQVSDTWQIGPFETEDIACENGREFVRAISGEMEKVVSGEVSGKYLDMKNGGILRPWESQ